MTSHKKQCLTGKFGEFPGTQLQSRNSSLNSKREALSIYSAMVNVFASCKKICCCKCILIVLVQVVFSEKN